MRTCIDLMTQTMASVSAGRSELPLRTVVSLPGSDRKLGVMPGYLGQPEILGTKLICLFPDNPARGLSSHTGVIVLFDTSTGQIAALLDAAAITALRTAAATAAASRVLARRNARTLALLGTGEQAAAHLESLCLVHPFTSIRIWGRDAGRRLAFAHAASRLCAATITTHGNVEDAIDGADVICSATAAEDPILKGEWLLPGTHVNLVGSSVPTTAEIDSEGVRRASYFVDYRPSALAQAGELKRAIAEGRVSTGHIRAEIGEIHLGLHDGRSGPTDITLYKSLGIAAQDLAAAHAVCMSAQQQNLGTTAIL